MQAVLLKSFIYRLNILFNIGNSLIHLSPPPPPRCNRLAADLKSVFASYSPVDSSPLKCIFSRANWQMAFCNWVTFP